MSENVIPCADVSDCKAPLWTYNIVLAALGLLLGFLFLFHIILKTFIEDETAKQSSTGTSGPFASTNWSASVAIGVTLVLIVVVMWRRSAYVNQKSLTNSLEVRAANFLDLMLLVLVSMVIGVNLYFYTELKSEQLYTPGMIMLGVGFLLLLLVLQHGNRSDGLLTGKSVALYVAIILAIIAASGIFIYLGWEKLSTEGDELTHSIRSQTKGVVITMNSILLVICVAVLGLAGIFKWLSKKTTPQPPPLPPRPPVQLVAPAAVAARSASVNPQQQMVPTEDDPFPDL